MVLMLSVGTRQSFGLFLQPMTLDLGWARETFGFAIAIQNIVWGLAQPFAGAIADKFGAARVIVGGGIFYALGLMLMAYSSTSLAFDLSAGLLVGLGLSGSGYGVVMGVVGRATPAAGRRAGEVAQATAETLHSVLPRAEFHGQGERRQGGRIIPHACHPERSEGSPSQKEQLSRCGADEDR